VGRSAAAATMVRPFPKLRRLLLNIASSTKLPQDEAIEIAKYFGENFDDERLRSDFFDVFVQLYVVFDVCCVG
jgi:nuclear cap-binding protein subunit 1